MGVLTRVEAVERRRLLDVRCVVVALDLDRGAEVFGSRTEIRFACAEPGPQARTFVDVKPAALRRVVLNGRELDPGLLADGRFPLDALAAENELLVEADMAYSRTGEGMHRFTDPEDGEAYVYTQAFLDDGPRVFAAFDQPDLKAPYQVTVTAPEGWRVVGNTLAVERPGGVWEFEPTQPIPSYLVAVVAGPLHSVWDEHDGIPLGLHARRSLARYLDQDAPEILEITRQCFDRYHSVFRERFPFGSYDQCLVPEFNAGAMENPGCVTFREEYLFRAAVTEAQREERGLVIAHEMAHMWFGDLVTMRWWDDLWLNESFAEFMGQWVLASATRFTEAWTGFAASRKPWGYAADQRPSTHPVAPTDVPDTAQALLNFDGISYAKGASALRQLMAWLGEGAFLDGVNAHFARHRFGNAGLEDLLDALAAESGRDVHGWAERWLRTTGVDLLRVVEGAGAGELRHLAAGPVLRPHLVEVGLYDGELKRFESVQVELGGDGRPVPLAGGLAGDGAARGAVLVLPNDGDLTYAKVRLDAGSLRTARNGLGKVGDSLSRAVLWTSFRDAVRDGEIPPQDYLALMEGQLGGERSVRVLESALGFAQHPVADLYLPPERREDALGRLAEVCRGLVERGADGGVRLAAMRGLIDASDGDGRLAELAGWLEREEALGIALDPELRWRILLRLGSAGAIGEAEIAAELERDPGDTGQEGAARCRAALPDPAAKERAWAAAFEDDRLSNYLLRAVLQGFWQPGPGQAGVLEPYVRRYFAEAPAVVGGRGPAVGKALGSLGFPGHAADPRVLRAAEDLLAGEEPHGVSPARRAWGRAMADSADDLRRAVRVREPAGTTRPAGTAGTTGTTTDPAVAAGEKEGAK
jgi:aminopeptidase N